METQCIKEEMKMFVSQPLLKTELWKALFVSYKPVITHHLTLSKLLDPEQDHKFVDEADLLTKDELTHPVSKGFAQKLIKSELEQPQPKHELKESEAELKKQIIPVKEPTEPMRPDPDDCCGDGCKVCVFDRYYQDLEKYEEDLEKYNEYQKPIKSKDSCKAGLLLDW